MTKRYFTPGEVEALIPELTRVMGAVMAAHEAAGAIRSRLRSERQRVSAAGGGMIDRAEWQDKVTAMEAHVEQMERGLGRITELGGAPKDLGLGLVDFPHLRGDREVSLCWKHGESAVCYWHGLDEGYAARKPL
jgi:hypothetical protein